MDNVILNKTQALQRCLVRIREVYDNNQAQFRNDYTRQDSVVLNLQRACEASIDIANRVIKQRSLGIPQHSRDSFVLLEQQQLLSPELSKAMQNMVGLRNVAVHDYQALNLDIVVAVVENHLGELEQFIAAASNWIK